MMKIFTAFVAVTLTVGCCSSASAKSYSDGFCEGYGEAVKAVLRNRDHYRLLMQQTSETHDDVIKRLYSHSPYRDTGSIVDRTASIIIDGIDLYVVLPELRGTAILEDGSRISCEITSPPNAEKAPPTP